MCLRLATIKGHSNVQFYCIWVSPGGSENQSVSGVTTICLTQCITSPSHRVDQVVDCSLWNVGPLLYNGCAKLLDIGRNWNMLSYTPIQSSPNVTGWTGKRSTHGTDTFVCKGVLSDCCFVILKCLQRSVGTTLSTNYRIIINTVRH